MKQQKEFYAIAQNGTNKFLTGYKNREHALTFSAEFTNEVRCALIFEKRSEETKESMENLAKAVGGRLVKIKAEYEITEEDGSELQEPVESDEGYDQTRPKFGRGGAYEDPKMKAWRNSATYLIKSLYKGEKMQGYLKTEVTFYLKAPQVV